MTVTDQMWARGASAPVKPPSAPAPPAPPTYFPPTADGGRPGRGPRRRFPRWILGALVLVLVAAAGIGGGWALRGATSPDPSAVPSASPSSASSTAGIQPEQAKTQACNAYATNGVQWSTAYKQWLTTLTPGWRWDDPAVKDATARFDATASQVVAQINALVDPATPRDVADAIREYTSAVLAYAASHGTAAQDQMNAQERSIDAAATKADSVCGL